MPKFKSNKTGKTYDTLMDAVNDFRCPGPCGDGLCPLFDQVALGNGRYGHKCHKIYVESKPDDVAALIGCETVHDGTDTAASPEKSYIAVVRQSAVRDAQIAVKTDADPMDDDAWRDEPEAEVYLGVFHGENALTQAAAYGQVPEENVRLIEIGD